MHGHSETLVALECRLGERMVTFAILDTARANGLCAVERARIDQECDKILREVDALHERIAKTVALVAQVLIDQAPK